jgi:hypothetical protein
MFFMNSFRVVCCARRLVFVPLNMIGHIYSCMLPREIVFEDLSKEHSGY